ncbi:hypothetical protein [Solimonas sp. K1W22B-7]|uniref:hypothetical protein n=1 Tax=Solimonas sp. K1W22B-7 TaxID=2303331 RepID=UPI001968B34E|nr:hypothetical protein [Solimonas sp. K1W22B-7]
MKRVLTKVLAAGVVAGLLFILCNWETYSMAQVDPRALRDAAWASLQTPEAEGECPEIEVHTYDEDWPQAARDPSFLDGGSLLTLKRRWCAKRHVQLSVTYHQTDFQALRRMWSWRDGADGINLPVPGKSKFGAVKFRTAGTGSFQGKIWTYCDAKLRLGNYILGYRLDEAGDSRGCKALARQDVELLIRAVDVHLLSIN